MIIHYALQTHDRGNRDPDVPRYCGNSKHDLIKKSVTSFLLSVKYACEQRPMSNHVINIIDDHSSDETLEFLHKISNYFNQIPNISVTVSNLNNNDIMQSINACYSWLKDNASEEGLIYQVQDDYIFEETAIFEMVSMFFQLLDEADTHPIVMSFNDPYFWNNINKYKSLPRTLIPGMKRYWIQVFDAPCTFLTSKHQFLNNYDLCEKLTTYDKDYVKMEVETINTMFTKRGILGLIPITSVALHMQGELFMDPYIDWKKLWDSIPEVV